MLRNRNVMARTRHLHSKGRWTLRRLAARAALGELDLVPLSLFMRRLESGGRGRDINAAPLFRWPFAFAAMIALGSLAACDSSSSQSEDFIIHGITRDKDRGTAIKDVKVVLLGEKSQELKSDKDGYFSFKDQPIAHHVILRFEKEGYQSALLRVELDEVFLQPPAPAPALDAAAAQGVSSASARSAPILVDASIELERVPAIPSAEKGLWVAGWVYGAGQPAVEAELLLYSLDEKRYLHETLSDESGYFYFDDVKPGEWVLRVWPFDRDGNGIADFQLHSLPLGRIDSSTQNLSNLVIHLDATSPHLVGASFVDPSTRDPQRPSGYPISAGELQAGVSARLPLGRSMNLHWGSEVETQSASFSLRERAPDGSAGPVIPVLSSWQSNSVLVDLVPSQELLADSLKSTGYFLYIDSLRLKDGSVLFEPTQPGTLAFDLWEPSQTLENPTPELYFAHHSTTTRKASDLAFDAKGAFILDANGDPLRSFDLGDHLSAATGFSLTWPHLPEAAGYRIYARNTRAFSNPSSPHRPWVQVGASFSTIWDVADDDSREPDPGEDGGEDGGNEDGGEDGGSEDGGSGEGGSGTGGPPEEPETQQWVLAQEVMKGEFALFGPVGSGAPWLLGNGIELAVTTVNHEGRETPLDPSRTLTLRDTRAPGLLSASADHQNPNQNPRTPSAGVRLSRELQLSFSEPMDASTLPQVQVKSGNLSLASSAAASWNPLLPNVPVELSDILTIPVTLRTKGSCTEVLVDRLGFPAGEARSGDKVLVVSDASALPSGASNQLIFVSADGDTLLGESDNIVSSDQASGQVVLAKPLEFDVPAGSLACLASVSPDAVALVTDFDHDEDPSSLKVSDPTLFFRGQQIVLYLAPKGEDPGAFDRVEVSHVDTVSRTIHVSAPLSDLHAKDKSVALPLDFMPEYRLRPWEELELAADVEGAKNVEVSLEFSPELMLMVGDHVLFDVDGDLLSSHDRVEVKIKQVRFSPAVSGGEPERFRISVDLPAGTHYLRGVSRVIALGDSFEISGVRDSSQSGLSDGLLPTRNSFSYLEEDVGAGVNAEVFVY